MRALLRITSEAFPGDVGNCLGSYVVAIVQRTREIVGDLNWYVADVEAVALTSDPTVWPVFPEGRQAQLIGKTDELIARASQVMQFLSGVFIATHHASPQLREEYFTDDALDEDIKDAVIEMRAFDTSCIEVLVKDLKTAEALAVEFGVPVLDRLTDGP